METFFSRFMSLTITFYEEKKDIKSHNFVFELQTFSLMFVKVKRKAKAKNPKDSPLLKKKKKRHGLFFSITHSALAEDKRSLVKDYTAWPRNVKCCQNIR